MYFLKYLVTEYFLRKVGGPSSYFLFLLESAENHISNECALISRILSGEGMNSKPECLTYRINSGIAVLVYIQKIYA